MNTDATSKKSNSDTVKRAPTRPHRPRCIGRGWTPVIDAVRHESQTSQPNN